MLKSNNITFNYKGLKYIPKLNYIIKLSAKLLTKL